MLEFARVWQRVRMSQAGLVHGVEHRISAPCLQSAVEFAFAVSEHLVLHSHPSEASDTYTHFNLYHQAPAAVLYDLFILPEKTLCRQAHISCSTITLPLLTRQSWHVMPAAERSTPASRF